MDTITKTLCGLLAVSAFTGDVFAGGGTQPYPVSTSALAHRPSFEAVSQQYPSIPEGALQAIAYAKTRIRHVQPDREPPSCLGLPGYWGVMGLIENGRGYFGNTLDLVAAKSGMDREPIKRDPRRNVMAYARAFSALQEEMGIHDNDLMRNLTVIRALTELPSATPAQRYAADLELYEILSLLNDAGFMRHWGLHPAHADLRSVFGANNLKVLSAGSVTMDEATGKVTGEEAEYLPPEAPHVSRTATACSPPQYPPAIWDPAPSCNYSSRSGTAISAVVVHTVQGSYAGAISWSKNCSSSVSFHYVVRSSDGQVTQMLCEIDKGWHAKTANPYTIGIEHEGYINDASWYTDAMYNSSADLSRDIANSGYGINPLRAYRGPACSGGSSSCELGGCVKVKGHQQYPDQTHTDPGPNWNWSRYFRLINSNTPVTAYATASGSFSDSGGPGGNYGDDERKLYLFQPPGATQITLTFTGFDLEANWDYMYIYDGGDVWAPLIGTYTGTGSPGTVTSSGGSLLIEFHSDCATTASGWTCNWNSNATPADQTPPTTSVAAVNGQLWQTADFSVSFTDADNSGGSGIDKTFYQVIGFDGTEWRANGKNGFFHDIFMAAALHSDWTQAAGTWSVNSGSLYQSDEANGNTNVYAPLTQAAGNAYLYQWKMKMDGSGTNRRSGLHFFADNPSQTNRGNSYFVWFRVDQSRLEFYRVANDVFTMEKSVPLTVGNNQWYDYKVIYDPGTGKIDVFVDNAFADSWTDPSPLTSGSHVSFRSGNCLMWVDEFRVYRQRGSSATVKVGSAGTSDARFQNNGPPNDACRVNSIVTDKAGNVSAVKTLYVNVDYTPPDNVGTLNDGMGSDIDTTSGNTSLSANWSASADIHSDIATYWYAIGSSPGDTDVVSWTSNGTAVSVTHAGLSLLAGATYYFSVKAENGAGLLSAPVVSDGQYLDQTTSAGTEHSAIQVGVYPNPTHGSCKLKVVSWKSGNLNLTTYNLQLFDIYGKMILEHRQRTTNNQQLDISHLPDGIYILHISAGRHSYTQRVVKQ